jgi:hypothetical protein
MYFFSERCINSIDANHLHYAVIKSIVDLTYRGSQNQKRGIAIPSFL